ncbi:MAG TPA: polysaccharide deacetylase family protein [Tenericutes bacterium]|nr:polysaccharide deacetylase family protein [Mycoplasmatota bacterium]
MKYINLNKIKELTKTNKVKISKINKFWKIIVFSFSITILTGCEINKEYVPNEKLLITEVDYSKNNEGILNKNKDIFTTPKEQSVEEPKEQSVEQSVEELIEEPKEQLVEQSVEEPIEEPKEQSVEQSVEELIEEPKEQLVEEVKTNETTNVSIENNNINPVSSAAISIDVKNEVKKIALTFDDGPGKYTNKLLDILKKNDIKATFFVLGSKAKNNPDILLRMKEEGHQIANHSYDHINFFETSNENIIKNINKTEKTIESIVGEIPNYLRPPYGNIYDEQKKILDYYLIYWTNDTLDWKFLDKDKVADAIINDSYDGSIVLLHDIHKTSVEAVEIAIPKMLKQGFEFYTVEELFEEKGLEQEYGNLYRKIR